MQYINNQKLRAQLAAFDINPEQIKEVHLRMRAGEITPTSFIIPKELLRAPTDADYDHYSDLDKEQLSQVGIRALRQGELAVLWLNGGAATRYFNLKKITSAEQVKFKAELAKLTPAITNLPKGVTPAYKNISYLELKLLNLLKVTKELGLSVHPKVILMNSFVTDQATQQHLNELFKKYPELQPARFYKIIQRPLYPRFNKTDKLDEIDVYLDPKGNLSFAPCGHGDFLHLIKEFFQSQAWPEVKYLFFANIDNYGTTLNPAILGYHITQGQARTVELAAKLAGDKGGAPCFVNNQLEIVELMKFPADFDQDQITAFNTNSFWFSLRDLLNYHEPLPLILADKTMPETGVEVYQLEHFACDINLPSAFLELPRPLRFWPTKRYVDSLIYQTDPGFQALLKNEYGL